MTEEEASNKKCWRTLGTDRVGSCIGSACMAWRWEADDDYGERCEGWAADVQQGASAKDGPPTRDGFCGLAGKP